MPLIETLTIEVGSAVAKAILKARLRDSDVASDASTTIVDVLKSWTTDKITRRRAQRQLEEIGKKVGDSLLPIFEKEGAALDEASRRAIALAVAETLNTASSEVLALRDLDASKLATYLLAHPVATQHFNETEQLLYQRIIYRSCQYIVAIASGLPTFTEHTFAEVLKRESRLLEIAEQTLRVVNDERGQKRLERERRLQSMLNDHRGFINARLESFVGREQELAEVHQRIDELLPTGGYLLITGQAGQGKSSIVAQLVESAIREQNSFERVAFHFIPLTPPPDYQVALLRNLMARLILKYDLSDLFVASESRVALSEGFPKVLKEIAEKGGHEIIFIDGLDQLQADQQTGLRDLSFLPQGPGNPPQGIVFVLGTRPNDILRPLELLKPCIEYKLPNLSRADFDQILQHRRVTLERTLVNRFYETLNENALYLDLVAKELAERKNITDQEVEGIVSQIADDPENLFSLTVDRLRRQETLWTTVIKPVLGLLLVTNEPLTREYLKHLANLDSATKFDGEQLNQGLERLGGLILIDDKDRYSLFHLKLRDYLRQDRQRPNKKYVFDPEDEQRWHKCFIAWYEQDSLVQIWEDAIFNVVEQARRRYARQHYITHLYYAGEMNKLFSVLDEGSYGKAKVQADPSMHSYALDLDLGRRGAASAHWNLLEEAIYHLPHLWRYTLLRCSLASRADKYPKEAFELMLLLGQETKALGLAELLTSPEYKSQIFILIACHLVKRPAREREAMQLFTRAGQVIHSIPDESSKDAALSTLNTALGQVGLLQGVEQIVLPLHEAPSKTPASTSSARAEGHAGSWQKTRQIMLSISYTEDKVESLERLTAALEKAEFWREAEQVRQQVQENSLSIPDPDNISKVAAQPTPNITLERPLHWREAEKAALSIPDAASRAEALASLAITLEQAGEWKVAKMIQREAEKAALSIPDAASREETLALLAKASSQVGEWKETKQIWEKDEYRRKKRQVILTIPYTEENAEALVRLGIELVQSGLWQEAEQVIHSIPDGSSKVTVLNMLITALSQLGLWYEGERVTRTIFDQNSKDSALTTLSTALGQAGRWQDAVRIIQSISNETSKTAAITTLIATLGQAGRWQEAERVIRSISNETIRTAAITTLITTLGQASRWQEGMQFILSNAYISSKTVALSVLGIALGRVNLMLEAKQIWQEAEGIILSIPNSRSEAETLAKLDMALGQAGHWQEAEQVARFILEGSSIVDALVILSAALGQAGRWQEAEQVADSISEESSKVSALATLCTALSQAGRWQEAEQVAHSIPDELGKVTALTMLVTALGQANLMSEANRIWQEVEQVIRSIPHITNRAEALIMLGTALGQANFASEAKWVWYEAERVIRSIPYIINRAEALIMLGTALDQANRIPEAKRILQEAKQVIHSIRNINSKKAALLTTLGTTLVKAELRSEAEQIMQEAEQVAHSIPDESDKDSALASLSTALGQIGLWQEAEQVVRSIASKIGKSEALTTLGAALGQANLISEAKRVWQEAEQIIYTLSDERSKAQMLNSLADILGRYHEYEYIVRLVQTEWLRTTRRDDALSLLPLAFGLILYYSDLGKAFYDAFAWVDRFLQR